jgi:hypothetical protein
MIFSTTGSKQLFMSSLRRRHELEEKAQRIIGAHCVISSSHSSGSYWTQFQSPSAISLMMSLRLTFLGPELPKSFFLDSNSIMKRLPGPLFEMGNDVNELPYRLVSRAWKFRSTNVAPHFPPGTVSIRRHHLVRQAAIPTPTQASSSKRLSPLVAIV